MAEDEKTAEIEVDLTPEPEKEVEVEVVKAEEPPEKVIPADDGISELRRQLDAERAARAEAERRANEAAQQAYQAKNEVEDTNLHLINNAISTVKTNNDILKAQYREALSLGDYEKAAEINESMSENHSKLRDLQMGREALENRTKSPPPPPKPIVSDPVEALASQLTPRSAAWVRAHPECATDPRMYQKMIAAHQYAIADGIQPDTDEYFRTVEGMLRISPRRQETEVRDDPMTEAAKPVSSRTPPPAAPVSRAGTGTGSRPNVIRLTSEQREIAKMMKMTDKEYATHRLQLIEEGKIS